MVRFPCELSEPAVDPPVGSEPILGPFPLTQCSFVKLLAVFSSEKLRKTHRYLFREGELIRGNNKNNSLTMKPNVF